MTTLFDSCITSLLALTQKRMVSAMYTKKHKTNNKGVSKKLQKELHALIVYGCYKSASVLKSGDSSKKSDIMEKIHSLYMPKVDHS